MSTYQQWLGRITIGSSTDTIALDDNGGHAPTVTLDSGYYYIAGYTSETTDQLCEHITAQIVAASVASEFDNVVCSYSATTGKVSFVAGAGDDIDITFTDTALRTILGYDSDITALDNTAQTADNEAGCVWRPDRGLSDHPTQINRLFEPESNSIVYRSRDGTTYSVPGNILYRAQLQYQYLAADRVIIPSTGSVNQEFEKFFEDVIHAGAPIRLYPDRTLSASTSFVTVLVGDGESDLGAFSDYATRIAPTVDSTLWEVSIPVIKHVS